LGGEEKTDSLSDLRSALKKIFPFGLQWVELGGLGGDAYGAQDSRADGKTVQRWEELTHLVLSQPYQVLSQPQSETGCSFHRAVGRLV
jgi:hypothetical protein